MNNNIITTQSAIFHEKSWGYEEWITNTPLYCGKLLFIKKDKNCSFHFHKLKDEHFYVNSGKILLKYSWEDDISSCNELILNPKDIFHVPVLLRHQMLALEDSEIFEFSTQHFESDSYRIINGN